MSWTVKEYINEFKDNEVSLNNNYLWSKKACYGYVMLALEETDISEEQTEKLLEVLDNIMEELTIDEAEEKADGFYNG